MFLLISQVLEMTLLTDNLLQGLNNGLKSYRPL